jgi:DNA-binding MarR family transcriptional regulator
MTPATESTALAVDAILARFAKKGIGSIATARTLLFIYDQGNPTMGEIASHNGKTGAALTCTIDRLEKAGHVRRVRPNGDRRSIRIELTFTGRDVVRQLLTA